MFHFGLFRHSCETSLQRDQRWFLNRLEHQRRVEEGKDTHSSSSSTSSFEEINIEEVVPDHPQVENQQVADDEVESPDAQADELVDQFNLMCFTEVYYGMGGKSIEIKYFVIFILSQYF